MEVTSAVLDGLDEGVGEKKDSGMLPKVLARRTASMVWPAMERR